MTVDILSPWFLGGLVFGTVLSEVAAWAWRRGCAALATSRAKRIPTPCR